MNTGVIRNGAILDPVAPPTIVDGKTIEPLIPDYALADAKNLNGFVNLEDTTLAIVGSTLTLGLASEVTSYYVYVNGSRIKISSSLDIVLSEITYGVRSYVYMNSNGVLVQATLLPANVPVIALVLSDTDSLIYLGDERRNISMSSATRTFIDNAIGMKVLSGLAITATEAGYAVSAGTIQHGDRVISFSGVDATTNKQVFYYGGSRALSTLATGPYLALDGAPNYNMPGGSVLELFEGEYMLLHVFAVDLITGPNVISIIGRGRYVALADACKAAYEDILTLTKPNITLTPIGTIVYGCVASGPGQYTATPYPVNTGGYADFRNLPTVSRVSNSDIVLSGGMSGGQTINGGLNASETLTLSSTAHATKGNITTDSSVVIPAGKTLTIGTGTSPADSEFTIGNGSINSNEGTISVATVTADTALVTTIGSTEARVNAVYAATADATTVTTDTITEKTSAAGVTIDSVLLKDNTVTATSVSTDTISEKTATAGVTIDSVLLKDNTVTATSVSTDTISEKTSAAGVTVDGVLIKDGKIAASYIDGITVDHGALTGLTDDDHTQYALLAGRTTGQTITGGIAASETLILRSTSHGTKGKVSIDETTASTSAITGALVVAGGIGAGSLYSTTGTIPTLTSTSETVGTIYGSATTANDLVLRANSADTTTGKVSITTSTTSTSAITGALVVAGGVGITGDTFHTGSVNVDHINENTSAHGVVIDSVTLKDGTVTATSGTVGTIYGSATTGNDLVLRANSANTTTGKVSITTSTASTSATTGALVVAGGMGLGGDLFSNGMMRANYMVSNWETFHDDFIGDAIDARYNISGTVALSVGFPSCAVISTTSYLETGVPESFRHFNPVTHSLVLEVRTNQSAVGTGNSSPFILKSNVGTNHLRIWHGDGVGFPNYRLTTEVPDLGYQIFNMDVPLSAVTAAGTYVYWRLVSDKTNIYIYTRTSYTSAWTLRITKAIEGTLKLAGVDKLGDCCVRVDNNEGGATTLSLDYLFIAQDRE